MKKVAMGIITLAVFLVIVAVSVWALNYGMVTSNNKVNQEWDDVEAAFQRYLYTVPNHAQVARYSMEAQERIFTKYAEARDNVETAGDTYDPSALQQVGMKEMSGLTIAIQVEAVPEVKVEQLTELNRAIELAGGVINQEMREYNDAVRIYNNKIQIWPGSYFAPKWGFEPREGFKVQPEGTLLPIPPVELPVGG